MERQVKYTVHLNTLTLGVAIASKFAFQRKELIAIKDFPEQKVWFWINWTSVWNSAWSRWNYEIYPSFIDNVSVVQCVFTCAFFMKSITDKRWWRKRPSKCCVYRLSHAHRSTVCLCFSAEEKLLTSDKFNSLNAVLMHGWDVVTKD